MRIDPMVNGSNLLSAKLSLRVRRVASSVIRGVRITGLGHIKREDRDTA